MHMSDILHSLVREKFCPSTLGLLRVCDAEHWGATTWLQAQLSMACQIGLWKIHKKTIIKDRHNVHQAFKNIVTVIRVLHNRSQQEEAKAETCHSNHVTGDVSNIEAI